MAGTTLLQFFNPLGNTDSEITGLQAATYPLILNAANSYTYSYFSGSYNLIYDPVYNLLRIWDTGTPTVIYVQNTANGNWECAYDAYNRPSVLATYFTTNFSLTPPVYIRPVVTTNTIRYNWEVSTLTTAEYILTCASINSGSGGGTVTLNSTIGVYTYSGLTFGKTYECAIIGSNSGNVGNSTFFRTVTTGNPPDAPTAPSFVSTPTSITLSWEAPAGVQTPTIGWYVITDSNSGRQYNTRFFTTSLTIPFDGTAHTYRFQSVSDTGYSAFANLVIP